LLVALHHFRRTSQPDHEQPNSCVDTIRRLFTLPHKKDLEAQFFEICRFIFDNYICYIAYMYSTHRHGYKYSKIWFETEVLFPGAGAKIRKLHCVGEEGGGGGGGKNNH
jgi:hypothetical protein